MAVDLKKALQEIELMFNEQVPFDRVIGVKIEKLTGDYIEISFKKKDSLVGNYLTGALHGGVIASFLDVVGGVMAITHLTFRAQDENGMIDKVPLAHLSKFGTIDMRVDYLRTGTGKKFIATGSILKSGTKVTIARMELNDDEGRKIAVGTGSYLLNA
mgnify:CR=1 FL=1